MLYHGTTLSKKGNFGFAWSDDGIRWERGSDNPVIEASKLGKVVFFTTYIRHQDEDRYYLEAGTYSTTKVYLMVQN